jgi:ABC-type transport system involved in multi-copper enzyme maturation permease subunit
MNPFLKKEIRLLLPGWIVVLVLAIFAPWFSWQDPDISLAWSPLFVFFGVILVAVDTFGREFSLGTFSGLLSQPIERRQIWRTKLTLLLLAVALIFLAYFVSCEFFLHHALKNSVWAANPKIIGADFHHAIFGSVAAIFIALTGGLWTTLLLRQISAAFWITFLTPMGILMLLVLIMSQFFNSASDSVVFGILYGLTVLYVAAGFWFARRLFHRAQDAAWTGGVISFSRWRYFESGANVSAAPRRWKPFSALWKKEFQLHSISLFCAGGLLALHLGVFFLRAFYGKFHKNSLADVFSEMFWIFWLVMPLVIGCMAVAEERKLGAMDGQFCLPVSRRRQFIVKFVPAMIFGVLLGGVMPLFLEYLAALADLPNSYLSNASFAGSYFISGFGLFLISIFLGALGLALAGFWASTLAKNFLQALSIAIVSVIAFFFCFTFLITHQNLDNGVLIQIGARWWGAILPVPIGLLTIAVFIPWLAWRNFSRFAESGRIWRRNVLGIIGAVVFVLGGSAAIYNRIWEVFEPAEPPHGAAKFSLANPPKLQSDFQAGLQVQFPDGRIWCDNMESFWSNEPSRWKLLWQTLVRPLPKSAGPEQFLDGSNWLSAAIGHRVDFGNGGERVTGYLDSAGIQTNGTLWISSEAKPFVWTGAKMTRFGDENDWRQVASVYGWRFLLLKTDGTLWQWRKAADRYEWRGWQTNWPSVRQFQPERIGTDSDWQEISSVWGAYARKTDGSVWRIDFSSKTNDVQFLRLTNLDQVVMSTFSQSLGGSLYVRTAFVGKNGTLWIGNIFLNNTNEKPPAGAAYLPVGAETNWVAVATSWNRMVALKADGSLWQWPLTAPSTAEAIKIPPTPLGIHRDWVGLTGVWGGVVSLAADGSLWFWMDSEYNGALLKAPKQPELLANVLDAR